MKSAESLADNATRLLGLMRSSSQTAQVRRDALLANFLLASLLALLKYPFYPLFILDNGMNLISKSLTVLTPA